MKKTDCKVIFGIPALEGLLGLSKPTINKLICLVMPCDKLEGSTRVFHKDNIDDWFREVTNNSKPKNVKTATNSFCHLMRILFIQIREGFFLWFKRSSNVAVLRC